MPINSNNLIKNLLTGGVYGTTKTVFQPSSSTMTYHSQIAVMSSGNAVKGNEPKTPLVPPSVRESAAMNTNGINTKTTEPTAALQPASSENKGNKKYLYIGAGVLVLIVLVVVFIKLKK